MLISKILELSIEKQASDVIVVSNTYPYLKID